MTRQGNKRRFTDQMIKRINPPAIGRLEFGDELCPGLLFRITERGVKSFSIIYRVIGEGGVSSNGRLLKGKQRRITLGQWPVLGLKEAREKARELLITASSGTDPRLELRNKNLQRADNTVSNVVDRYIRLHAKKNIKNWKSVERIFEQHVETHWGEKSILDIRRSDVHTLLDDLIAQGSTGTAREVRKHLSTLFSWAVDREIVSDNPVYRLTRSDLKNNFEAGRALTDIELKAIWAAATEIGQPFGPWFQLLILTGQRRNEWANAKLSELDMDKQWLEVPRARYKGRRDHIVPLAPTVGAIIEALPKWTAKDPYLFSTTDGEKAISGFSRAKERLDKIATKHLIEITKDENVKLTSYRVHDFRVTCETRLATLGFNQEVRDAVLGHAQSGLQKTYNKHNYLEEKREALKAYDEHIGGITRGRVYT